MSVLLVGCTENNALRTCFEGWILTFITCVWHRENLLQLNPQMAWLVVLFFHILAYYHEITSASITLARPCIELNTCEYNQQTCSLEWVKFTRKIDARNNFFLSLLCQHFGRIFRFFFALLHFQLRVNKTQCLHASLVKTHWNYVT